MWLLILVEWFKKLLNTYLDLDRKYQEIKERINKDMGRESCGVQGVQLHSKSFFNNVMVDAIDVVL